MAIMSKSFIGGLSGGNGRRCDMLRITNTGSVSVKDIQLKAPTRKTDVSRGGK